jgi:uncharacterized Zn finger protein
VSESDEWWRNRTSAGPIEVEGGLVARSRSGAIGRSWWSKRFLAVLEAMAFGGRLTRGRTYARKGQVLELTLAPGLVTALVQGSRPEPYQATIKLDPFSAKVWAAVDARLAQEAIYSARLLAGELPPDLEDVLADAGAPLFPRSARDLRMACSCPDFGVPCKHLAAAFYLLAERFDADPFELLHWRGRSREELLARLREQRGAAPAEPADVRRPVGAAAVLAAADGPAPADPARFWELPALAGTVPEPDLGTGTDLLLRQLPELPAGLGGGAALSELTGLYRALGEPG